MKTTIAIEFDGKNVFAWRMKKTARRGDPKDWSRAQQLKGASAAKALLLIEEIK